MIWRFARIKASCNVFRETPLNPIGREPALSDNTRIPIRAFATKMRREPTEPETLIYNALLAAFKPYKATVRCQEPIGPYIADFYISPAHIVLEVDGSSHKKQVKYDQSRDTFMKKRGIRVIRVKNDLVHRKSKQIAQYVLKQCENLQETGESPKIVYCPPGKAKNHNWKKRSLNEFL